MKKKASELLPPDEAPIEERLDAEAAFDDLADEITANNGDSYGQ